MEETIWEGKASWLSGISVLDVILTFITVGFWIIIPIIKIIKLSSKSYRVTDERIIITSGIASRSESEIELYRVKDLAVNQGMIQKVIGIGNITIRSSSETLEMKGIPNAYVLREKMRNAVSGIRKNNIRVNEAI